MFNGNAAWVLASTLPNNLIPLDQLLGAVETERAIAPAGRRDHAPTRAVRPERLTRSARRSTLHLTARLPRHQRFVDTLERLRALAVL